MTPWSLLKHDRTVRRTHDWQRGLGAYYPEWAPLLDPIGDPVGLRFLANFGAGETEYELARDGRGFVALPVDGITPHRMNATEAEFSRLDLLRVLDAVARGALTDARVEALRPGGPFGLGKRPIAGRSIALMVVLGGLDSPRMRDECGLAVRRLGAEAALLLTPGAGTLGVAVRDALAAARVAVAELPASAPWRVDWSSLIEVPFQIPLEDPAFFFGARHAVIVDPQQQRIWLEGRELKVKADGHSYRLLAHLAENAGMVVPTKVLANKVLEAESDRSEAKIVSDAKSELMKAIKTCLTPPPVASRLDAASLVVIEDGRARLNIDASLVKVIRRLSDR